MHASSFRWLAIATLPALTAACSTKVETPSPSTSPPPPTTLATDGFASAEIAVANGTVFWADRNPSIVDSIKAVPATGGPTSTFYTSPDDVAAIEAIAVDATSLYLAEVEADHKSTLKRIPLGGGAPETIAANDLILSVAVDAAGVYYSDFEHVFRVSPQGGAVETLAPPGPDASPLVTNLAANGNGAWWLAVNEQLTIMHAGADAGAEPLLALPSVIPLALALNQDHVFFGTVPNAPSGGPSTLVSVAMAGAAAKTLTEENGTINAIAADDTNVYWLSGDAGPGTLQKVPVGGGASTAIATYPHTGTRGGLALDGARAYWTSGGVVMSVPK